MASTKTKKKPSKKSMEVPTFLKDGRWKRILGLVFLLVAFLMTVSFASHVLVGKADMGAQEIVTVDDFGAETIVYQDKNALGRLGAWMSNVFVRNMFGLSSFMLAGLLAIYGVNLLFAKKIFKVKKLTYHVLFLSFFLAALFEFVRFLFFKESYFHPGGFIGYTIAGSGGWLVSWMKAVGTSAFLFIVGLAYLIIAFDFKFDFLLNLFTKKEAQLSTEDKQVPISMDESIFEKDKLEKENPVPVTITPEKKEEAEESGSLDFEVTTTVEEQPSSNVAEDGFDLVAPVEKKKKEEPDEDLELNISAVVEEKVINTSRNEGSYDPTLDLSNYKYPPLDMLVEHGSGTVSINKEELEQNKNQIVETLRNYNIEISKIKATVGPTVTLYEIIPAPGVRISKIKNLEDDIALSLAALGIRIIAPIPGKGTIGIEVPNATKEIVSMRSILASEKFRTSKAELPIGLGKNIANEIFIADLAKMPHMLMAGATGQGKSVGINAVLVSLLYKKHPSQLKFVLVDPKKVELSIYNTIEKHFLAILPGEEEAIITDVQKVVLTLNALCKEMDERYDLLKTAKARNIKEYNKKFTDRQLNPLNGHKFLPYIVLIIDEFADLIMTAGKEVETPVARLAQLARAIGIHLILATQRPSVNIITGVIKANFPARISFRVSSKIDSRTILDAGGADQLIGRGDMLFSQGSDMVRLQCAFVDTPEVEEITTFIGEQQGYPEVFQLPEVDDPNAEGGKESYSASERDALFEDAARVVVTNQVGSTSMIQRRLKLGYNRAGRLMDQLEDAGIVGPNVGSKAREVYYKSEAELDEYLKIMKQTGT
ncbi:MAG: DNA translocase FtsK 4TM domain-containing protein [Chitinophagales bacterium]